MRSVEELLQLARSKPGSLDYGTSSVGSPHHLVTEMFAQANGLNMVHVPFKGSGETVTALLAGTVPLATGLPSSFAPHIRSGKFRALADKAYVEDQLGRHALEPFEQPSAAAASALTRNYYDKLAPVVKRAGIKGD